MGRLRGPLAVALLLTALLTLVNVQAYSRAAVTDPTRITVTTVESAALALLPTSPMASLTSSSVLLLDFARGFDSSLTLQLPTALITGDDFRMLRVFEVQNNALPCANVSIDLAGTVPNLFAIQGRVGTTTRTLYTGGKAAESFQLNAGEKLAVDFWWRAVTAAQNPVPFEMRVIGSKCY